MMANLEQTRRALLTYAFVNDALNSHDDVFMGLTPFFEPISEELRGQVFDPSVFSNCVQDMYSLYMTRDVSEYFIPRLVRAGYIIRDVQELDKALYRWSVPEKSSEEIERGMEIERDIDHISEKFFQFIQEIPTLFTITLSKDELLDWLFDWLVRSDPTLHEAEVALGLHRDGVIEDVQADTNGSRIDSEMASRGEQDYLCARFVGYLEESKSPLFDELSRIASAALVSEVIIDLKAPIDRNIQARDLCVYLDAPFCMDVLGLTGSARHENASYIYEKLTEMGVRLILFSHSVDEISDNLKAVLGLSSIQRFGPTGDAIRRGELAEDYAAAVHRDVDSFLNEKGVQIFDTRTSLPVSVEKYFDDNMMGRFCEELTDQWPNIIARERDAISVAMIMRRRAGSKTRNVFKSKYVMISHNPVLAWKAHRFCMDELLYDKNSVGPVIHQRRMAALLWLTVGAEARLTISKKQLIVNCANVLRTRPSVIAKMRNTLERVRPELKTQFDALLSHPRCAQLAMDLTLNVATVVTEQNIDEIYEVIKQSTAEKEKDMYLKKLKDLRKKENYKISQKEEKIRSLEEELSQKKSDIYDLIESDRKAVEAWVRSSVSSVNRTILFARAGASLMFGFVFLLAPLNFPSYFEQAWQWMGAVAAFGCGVCPIWFSRPNRLDRWAQRRREKLLQKYVVQARKELVLIYGDIDWQGSNVKWHGKYARSQDGESSKLL